MSDRTLRAKRRQVGALCWRLDENDRIQFLLVTSRDTGRWVTPKGNQMKGLTDAEAAAEEAMEEAGATGPLDPESLGTFIYDKRLSGRAVRRTAVDIYSLQVTHLFETWPEAHERERRWFSRLEAVEAVDEPELKVLIAGFVP
ncbi:MAG TPA: NUDIX hydrolase [Brevundimonas sp.]|uniref:NUDIX hydrolase n=1 Tax=Brevundimonas sp. TaxID=1871086 RepID=UPI002B5AC929|nr:NUDIX hydrolase [Brevundimonas sp.]HRH20472.1 NUDIX hydrolase [Brevundimonas sp.]